MSKKRKSEEKISFGCSNAFVFDGGETAEEAANNLIASLKKTRRIAKILPKEITKEKAILPKQGTTLSEPLHQVDVLSQEVGRTLLKDFRYNLRYLHKVK